MSAAPDSAEVVARSFAAMAEVPGVLRSLVAEVAALRAEVASLRSTLPPALVTLAEAAERLGVSVRTLRRRVKDGTLPVRRIGRSLRVDLDALRPASPDEVERQARAARSGSVALRITQ